METEKGDFCWVKTSDATARRSLRLGDSNDVFIVVEAGLKEGDEVVLNPTAFVEEAQTDALQTLGETKTDEPDASESGTELRPPKQLEDSNL